MKPFRFLPPLALVLAGFLLGPLDASVLRAEESPRADRDQPAAASAGLRVAVLPVVNTSGDVDAPQILARNSDSSIGHLDLELSAS